MEATIFFNTGKGKLYLYDFYKNSFLLAHPYVQTFYLLDKKQYPMESWKERCLDAGEPIDEAAYEYNLKKYFYLKESGFFKKLPQKRVHTEVDKQSVENALDDIAQIVFEMTDKCNLNCKYCAYGEFYSNYDQRETTFLDEKAAIALLDFFIERWKTHPVKQKYKGIYVSFYGGEPLLNVPLMRTLMSYVEKNFPTDVHPTYTMTTNGVLLKKYIDLLVEKNFQIMVSLDGDSSANGYRVTKAEKESFTTIYENLKYVQEQYPQFFKENINFNSVLHNRNSVDSILSFFQNEFDKVPHVSELNENGIRSDKREEFSKTYKNIYENLSYVPNRKEVEDKYFVRLPKAVGIGIFASKFLDNHYEDYLDFFRTEGFHTQRCSGACIPFSKKIFLTVNNKLLACERIGQEHALGTVEDGVVHIDSERIAAMYTEFNKKVEAQCNSCYLLKVCTKCMYYFSDLESPVCDEHASLDHVASYLKKHIGTLEKERTLYKKVSDEVMFE